MKISLVTATYNREKLLHNLYESIVNNYKTFKDIEWIIIDDGSVDNTKKIVDKWIKNSKFEIKYYYQENQGKMRAINNVMKYVTGDIIIEIDSDDFLVDNVLSKISNDYKRLDNENVYGIVYKKKIIGENSDVKNIKEIDNKVIKMFDIYNKYEYELDLALTFKADIRKKYNYPLEKDEKFVTEARLYYRLDKEYDGLLFENEDIIVAEYREDGYTENIKKVFKKYPFGYYEFFKECLSYCNINNTVFKKRLYFIKHYILFSYLTKKKKRECIKGVKGFNKLLVFLLIIPGYIKSSKF